MEGKGAYNRYAKLPAGGGALATLTRFACSVIAWKPASSDVWQASLAPCTLSCKPSFWLRGFDSFVLWPV
jgi:hypothetical protein